MHAGRLSMTPRTVPRLRALLCLLSVFNFGSKRSVVSSSFLVRLNDSLLQLYIESLYFSLRLVLVRVSTMSKSHVASRSQTDGLRVTSSRKSALLQTDR